MFTFQVTGKDEGKLFDTDSLDRGQRTALSALMRWRELFESLLPGRSTDLCEAMAADSFIPRDLQLTPDCALPPDSEGPIREVAERIRTEPEFADEFLKDPAGAVADTPLSPVMTEARSHALRSITERQAAYDTVNLDRLETQFPFSLDGSSFFGKFLRQAESPSLAARNLASAAPFLHDLRAIVEAVADPEVGIAAVDTSENNGGTSPRKMEETNLFEIICRSIQRADDLCGNSPWTIPGMVVVEVPPMPPLIAPNQHLGGDFTYLSVAEDLAKWFLYGDVSGRSLRARHLFQNGPMGWITDFFHPTILRQVEKSNPEFLADLADFRKRYAEAVAGGARVVFRYTPDSSSASPDSLGLMLNAALSVPREDLPPSLRQLADAGFIFNKVGGALVAQCVDDKAGRSDRLKKRMQIFRVAPHEISPSALTVLAPLLEKDRESAQMTFRARLVEIVPLPGIGGENAESFFGRYCARYFPGGSNFAQDVEVLFRYAPYLSEKQFDEILLLLRAHNVHSLTGSSVELAREKFHLPTQVLEKYRTYCSYRPVTVGSLPPFFEDAASFEEFAGLCLDARGLAAECDQLEQHLSRTCAVAVVDNTSYHPELISEIAGESIQTDVEGSSEVWGKYTRPGRRLVNCFAQRVVSGRSAEFSGWSVIRTREPRKIERAQVQQYRKLMGLDVSALPSISEMNEVLETINTYNDHTIVILNAESIENQGQLRTLLDIMRERHFKVVVRSREAIPGLPQVLLKPWTEDNVRKRLENEREQISSDLGLVRPVSDDVLSFVCEQIAMFRDVQGDPLNYAMVILHAAANHARVFGELEIIRQDVVAALPAIFHLPDTERTRLIAETIDEFAEKAPTVIFGQPQAILDIVRAVKSHLFGTRDPRRPLALLLPGPTGVGKTELLEILAILAGVPFMRIQGSQYADEHSGSGLFGSPTGFVGPDQGPLYRFVKENQVAIVFLDEIGKMHPAVRKRIMELLDKGRITAGDGETCTRPGLIVVAADNAGAEKLRRGMPHEEVKQILADAFRSETGTPQPEFVARFQVLPMPAIEEAAFREVIMNSLRLIGDRYGLIAANIDICDVDDGAVNLLYEAAKTVCAQREHTGRIGFENTGYSIGTRSREAFFDMRYVFTACDSLAQDSIVKVVQNRHETGESAVRGAPLKMKLISDEEEKKILLVPVDLAE